MRRYTSLTPAERARTDRRLRLVWASGGDRDHAAGVERVIATGARMMRGQGRHGAEPNAVERLRAAYNGARGLVC